MAHSSTLLGIIMSLSIVSQVFILGIIAVWILFNWRFTPAVVEQGPTILTTLGIFGTFLGVALGLSHFDTTNVQASVPSLLAGLKTAFWASVFGVGAAVQIKIRDFVAGMVVKRKAGGQGASPLAVLVDIREALAGYGDTSLPQQIRALRQDMGDRLVSEMAGARKESAERLDALRAGQKDTLGQMELAGRVQQKALQQLAGGATESLVAALQRVVTDFNHKVASQFGENYRELGDAVRQVLAWQVEYRESVRGMTDQLADTLRQLGYAASDFRGVAQGSERFAQTADRVARVMDGIEAGEDRLMVLAQGMARLTEEAAGRVPFIESRLFELTSQMTRAVQANQLVLAEALRDSAHDMAQSVDAVRHDLGAAAASGAAGLRDNQEDIAAALRENATAIKAALHAMHGDMAFAVAGFEGQMATMIAAAGKRIVDMDADAAAGLTQSVGRFVGSLTCQLEAATASLSDRAPRPRPVLHVVGEAVAVAEE